MSGRARGLASLAVLALVAGVPGAGIAERAQAAESPVPRAAGTSEDSPVEVSVSALAPRALSDPDQFLQVAGLLTNTGSTTVRDLTVRLMVGDRLDSRGALAAADLDPPALRPVATTVRPETQALAPGASTRFDIRLRVGRLGLGRLGVYPLGVRVRGEVEGFPEAAPQIGLVQTYLPWFPDGQPEPARVAWLWPLVDVPRRAPREAMLDEELTTSLAPGGRLSQLLVGARAGGAGECDRPAAPPPDATVANPPVPCTSAVSVPVTYAVDPDLAFTARALSSRYDVLDGDDLRSRPASVEAREWLDLLRDELGQTRSDLLVLPYADPDVVSLASDAGLDADLAKAAKLGASVSREVLGDTPQVEVAWPPAGPLTQAALDASIGPQTTAVVLDEAALPVPTLTRQGTLDARTALPSSVSDDVTGLVVDDALSRLLEPGPATAGKGPRLAEQRWLVETAMLVAEAPSRSRTVLVAPPRRGTVPQAVAGAVIADTGRVPWLCPVALRDVAAGTASCEPTPTAPQEPEIVSTLETPTGLAVLSPDYLAAVQQVQVDSDQLTGAVLAPGPEASDTAARLLRARLRAESSAWVDAPAGGRRLLSLLQDDVRGLREQVVVRVGGKVTLTSDSGTIRVNLQNALRQPVTVRVRLTAPAARLSVDTTPEVRVEPETVKPVDLEVEALVSGQFVVEAQLLDREMRPFGEATRLVVRSTRYGRVALGLTGLGAAGLLVAVGVRLVRRAVRGHRSDPDHPSDPDQPDQPGASAPAPA